MGLPLKITQELGLLQNAMVYLLANKYHHSYMTPNNTGAELASNLFLIINGFSL